MLGDPSNRVIRGGHVCRSIKTLFNFAPPVTDSEIRAAALQFVRKISGFHSPSSLNEPAFELGVREIEAASHKLLASLQTEEAAKAKSRSALRFQRVTPTNGEL
jgi:hypothetical protein